MISSNYGRKLAWAKLVGQLMVVLLRFHFYILPKAVGEGQ